MKVLILMPLAKRLGGAERALEDFLKYGGDKGLEIVLVFFEEGEMVSLSKNLGIKTFVINSGRLRNPLKFVRTVFSLSKLVKQEKIDLIFSWMSKSHFYGSLVSRLAGVKSGFYQHSFFSPTFLDKLLFKLPRDFIFCCSNSVLVSLGNNAKFKVKVIYPGVDLDSFKSKNKKLSSKTVIGIFARLQSWKGIHVLVKAMEDIKKYYPQVICLIVGSKHKLELDYEEHLRKLISSLNLENNVEFIGHKENVADLINKCDLVVNASGKEPFGLSILEAMACGKPVIATNIGGPKEIITNNKNGVLIEPNNPKLLAETILNLLKDKKKMKELGKNAIKRARDFDSKKLASNLSLVLVDNK